MEEKKYNNNTVEINTIQEEEIENPKDKSKFVWTIIGCSFLLIYIIYLIVVIFIS